MKFQIPAQPRGVVARTLVCSVGFSRRPGFAHRLKPMLQAEARATIFFLVVLALASCSKPKQPAVANQYVAGRVCASCHAEIYQTYRKTGMARAFYPPSPESVAVS
jgi:hypothetical protein